MHNSKDLVNFAVTKTEGGESLRTLPEDQNRIPMLILNLHHLKTIWTLAFMVSVFILQLERGVEKRPSAISLDCIAKLVNLFELCKI